MKFKTHVTPKQTLPVLATLLDRGLTVADIVRQSGVSRKAIENILAGNNSRQATYQKLADLDLNYQMFDRRRPRPETEEQVVCEASVGLWRRFKTWLTARFA